MTSPKLIHSTVTDFCESELGVRQRIQKNYFKNDHWDKEGTSKFPYKFKILQTAERNKVNTEYEIKSQ